MNGGYIPINKGNYDMDTDERIEQFELNRAEGWEEDYRKYRENWSKYPRQQYVSDHHRRIQEESLYTVDGYKIVSEIGRRDGRESIRCPFEPERRGNASP